MSTTLKRQNKLSSILADFNGTALFNEPMSRHTSFGIGGQADVIFFPDNEKDLSGIIRSACKERIPLFMLGEGTNLLVLDSGIRGIVVSLSSGGAGECFKSITTVREDADQEYVCAGAGVNLSALLKYTVQKGLSGIEFVTGIPGSLGGAVVMNAGSYGKEMKDILDSVRVIDGRGNTTDIDADNISFCYRSANIRGKAVVSAELRLRKADTRKIQKSVKEILHRKKDTQPVGKRNAGSIFRNPEGMKAWELIDAAGMRGVAVGGASVSKLHSNFIVNNGNASAKDVLSLIRLIGSKVEREAGITLELEMRVVGI